MAEKTITLILLRADRKLWDGEGVRLQVTDVNRVPLVILFDQKLKPQSHTVLMNLDLLFNAAQVYGISVDVKKHRSAWQLINRRTFIRQQGGAEVEVKDVIMQLMLVPRQASSSNLKDGYQKLLDRGSPMVAANTGLTEQAYLDLKPAAQMALLNIEAKLRDTRLNGVSLLSFVEGVRFVKVDRLYLFMRAEVKHLVEVSAEFGSAPGHAADTDVPIALPAHPDSWKHLRFGAGNLQLSFAKTSESLPTDASKTVFSVDADIDLERGLKHVFEWLDNKLLHPEQKTDQTQVYALLFSQGILPDYTLDPLTA
jgi:hypothetical protein